MTQSRPIEIPNRVRIAAFVLIATGVIVAVNGVISDPARAWPNLLLNAFYFATLAVSAMFFLATQRVTGARWSASLRRVPEAFLGILPFSAVLVLAVYFGRHVIYSWSNPGGLVGEPGFAGRLQYLQPRWVFTRALIVLAAWLIFARLFRRTSLQQDARPEAGLALHQKLNRYAVIFILVFAITLTAAAFDWILSADPRWFSTMYAVYVFAGTFVQGIAAVTLAVLYLKRSGPLAHSISEHQLHDLGKMLFAFSTFWAYIWTCQYLLIWYGNIPEEVTHYVSRTNGPWIYLFALNLIANWVIPFLTLLSVRAKCTHRVLKAIAILLLCGHWLDLYLLLIPSIWKTPKVGMYELAMTAGCAAFALLIFVRNFNRAEPVPLNDPILAFEQMRSMKHEEPAHSRIHGVAQ
jgi:hypothetical protein